MRRLAPLTVALLLVFVGQAVSATTDVTVVDFSFTPSPITIAPGGTVHWSWSSSNVASHSVSSDAGQLESFDSGIQPHDSLFDYTFQRVGDFTYHCNVHSSMHGDVVVAGIGGRVVEDLNGNGVTDAGEPGMAGVTVALSGGPSVQTAADGYYAFTDPGSGSYTVTATIPSDHTAIGSADATFSYTTGAASAGHDFFAQPKRHITGTVYNDANANGVADAGEAGLGGVSVFLDRSGDGVRQSAEEQVSTDNAGAYTLIGVPGGSQRVAVDVPAGYDATAPRTRTAPPDSGADFFVRPTPATPPSGGTGDQTPITDTSGDNIDLLAGAGSATNGDDSLSGTNKADRIFGLGGADLILGLGGDDYLDGGPGDDSLDGGSGNDKLFGRAGNDILRGGSGNDRLVGGPGIDRLYGGAGNDVLIGGRGEDFYYAGAGSDRISAADGVREVIDCGKGRDRVTADKKDRVKRCEKVTRR